MEPLGLAGKAHPHDRPGQRAAADFMPGILPHHAQALGPEICRIVWQK